MSRLLSPSAGVISGGGCRTIRPDGTAGASWRVPPTVAVTGSLPDGADAWANLSRRAGGAEVAHHVRPRAAYSSW